MVQARKYVVKKRFEGLPKRNDYEIVEYELPPLKNGEILVKGEWVSVDPYQRAYNSLLTVPYDQFSMQLGIVEESKNPKFPVGTRVISQKGWCTYSIIDPSTEIDTFGSKVETLQNLKGLSPSLSVGALALVVGGPAYYGFLNTCKPKSGETVVVTGAAGAVGSLVGQIAKIKGCKVIGFCGSDEKVKWLEKDLGFDKALNYKTVDIASALKEAAPNGVDCYFDNVGGEITKQIISQMNSFGRIAVCGSISSYNDSKPSVMEIPILDLLSKHLIIGGVSCTRWPDIWYTSEGYANMIKWIQSGELKAVEDVTEGFENIFEAFIGVLQGKNVGKAVVKIS